MSLKTIPFDIVAELDSNEAIHEYLAQLASDSGLGRESLYNALKPVAKPRFDTILRVCHALGLNLQARDIQSHR